MKQGSATVGIKSNTHVVLVALKVCISAFVFTSQSHISSHSNLTSTFIYLEIVILI